MRRIDRHRERSDVTRLANALRKRPGIPQRAATALLEILDTGAVTPLGVLTAVDRSLERPRPVTYERLQGVRAVAERAVGLIAGGDHPDKASVLVSVLTNGLVANIASEMLLSFDNRDAVVASLIDAAEHRRPRQVEHVARILGEIRDPRSIRVLLELGVADVGSRAESNALRALEHLTKPLCDMIKSREDGVSSLILPYIREGPLPRFLSQVADNDETLEPLEAIVQAHGCRLRRVPEEAHWIRGDHSYLGGPYAGPGGFSYPGAPPSDDERVVDVEAHWRVEST
jgi:hypothetical protein